MQKSFTLPVLAVLMLAGCATAPESSRPTAPLQTDAIASDPKADLMYELLVGEVAGQMGHLEDAVVHYVSASMRSDDPRIAERATRIAVYAQDDTQALVAAERWVALAPDNMEARQFAAVLYVRNDQPQQAVVHFEELLKASAATPDHGFLLIGSILSREADAPKAMDAMALLVSRHPREAHAHFVLANLALRAERYDVVIRASEQALALDPDLVDARVMRARALLAQGETERALADMQGMLKEMPKNHDLRLTYARMLVQVQRYDLALEQFEIVSKARPDDADLLYTLGLLSMEAERYDHAERYLKRVIKSGRNQNEAKYYLGRIDEQRKRYKSAMKWFLSVGEGEFFWDAQARTAAMMAHLGRFDEARGHLKRLRDQVSDQDTQVRLYLAEGQLLREQKAYAEGMALYDQALMQFPGHGDLLYARALMAEKVDRLDLLEADLRAILAREPDNATAMNALGYTLADKTDRQQEALRLIQRAYELRPDDPAVIDSMGWVHFRLGQYAEAERYLRQAYTLLDDAEVAAHLAEVLWVQGRAEEAMGIMNEALKKNPDNEVLLEFRGRIGE